MEMTTQDTMTTIYCSKKLETFIGPISQKLQSPETSSIGDWNAHLFTIERMKCLLFMNNWNDVQVTRILNDYPIGTKILVNKRSRRGHFRPIELMEALLR